MLSLRLDGASTGGGTAGVSLLFTNQTSSSCVLGGYPGVAYVAGNRGVQVGPVAKRDGAAGPRLTLPASGSARFQVVVTSPNGSCREVATRGFRVYPPDQTTALYVPFPFSARADGPAENLLVRTITA